MFTIRDGFSTLRMVCKDRTVIKFRMNKDKLMSVATTYPSSYLDFPADFESKNDEMW